MSCVASSNPGGQPSTTPPYAGPCDSPNEVTQYRTPKVFPDMRKSSHEKPARLEHARAERLALRAQSALGDEVEEQRVVQTDLFQNRRRALGDEAERHQLIDREHRHHAGQRIVRAVEEPRMPG